MRHLLISICLLCLGYTSNGQTLEDSLAFYADVLLHAEKPAHRSYAHQLFDKNLRREMISDPQFEQSFSLIGIPLLYAPDSSFRLISWQIQLKDESQTYAYLQLRGQEQLFEFEDKFAFMGANEYGTLPPDRWIGAVYTDIYSVPGKDSLYLLKGFNHIDPYSTLQVLEILDMRSGEIGLGAPIFENEESEIVHRRIFEVAQGANFNIVISDSLQRIVTDHLVAVPFNRDESKMVNVPDGSYEVLEWEGDHWVYKNRLFERRFQELPMDSVPRKNGNRDIFGRPKGQ